MTLILLFMFRTLFALLSYVWVDSACSMFPPLSFKRYTVVELICYRIVPPRLPPELFLPPSTEFPLKKCFPFSRRLPYVFVCGGMCSTDDEGIREKRHVC
uniref:T. congolense-specific, cell surface-expressed gene family n=1 Tax=Trypanosoma congolense (strain IL3000) TaxID=1068625 RepID=G0UZ45_TRYCI|nr:hypothetical protein, unlikely [Trypanosoma congolense IL3000]